MMNTDTEQNCLKNKKLIPNLQPNDMIIMSQHLSIQQNSLENRLLTRLAYLPQK